MNCNIKVTDQPRHASAPPGFYVHTNSMTITAMLSNDKMSNFDSLDLNCLENEIEHYINENPTLETPDVNLDVFDWTFGKPSVSTTTSTPTSYGKMMSQSIMTDTSQSQRFSVPNFANIVPEMSTSPYNYSLAEYQEFSPKLETSDVNYNSPLRDVVSPSMMQPVSPGTIFPGVYPTDYSSDYTSPSMPTTTRVENPTAPSYIITTDYFDPNMLGPLDHMSSGSQPFSPKSISSNESNFGEEKTFANLDNATLCYQQQQQQQLQAPVQIKQEVIEDIPTVLSEFLSDYQHQSQQQLQAQPSSYGILPPSASNVLTTDPMFSQTPPTTTNRQQTNSFAQYQPSQAYSIPVTIQGAVRQQQLTTSMSHQQCAAPTSLVTLTTPSTPSTGSNSRRRGLANTTPKQAAGVTKKTRMSKREKQLLMEQQITNYLKEKDDLSATITLLTKKIEFCKKYLSENVKPFIQHQHQQQLFQQVAL